MAATYCNVLAWRDGALREVPPEGIRDARTDGLDLLWLRLTNPGDADWDWLGKTFDLPVEAVEDARKTSHRQRMVAYPDHLGLSLRVWRGDTGAASDDMEDVTDEVDLLIGPRLVVEVHRGDPLVVNLPEEPQVSALLYAILDSVLDRIYPSMDAMDEEMDGMETAAYTGDPSLGIGPALHLKKRLLLLRQSVLPLRDAVSQMLHLPPGTLDADAARHLHEIFDRSLRLTEQIDLHREILSGVLEAIMAQASNRLNQQMKRMTALAAIILPVTAITGFFGMNIGHFDRAPSALVYWASGLMLLAVAGTWLVLRRKGYW